MRRDVGPAEPVEHRLAGQHLELRVVARQHLEQPGGIGVAIDVQHQPDIGAAAALRPLRHRVRLVEQVPGEVLLQRAQVAHAAAGEPTEPAPAMARACPSSATSSGSGGILSSRSIMVDTGPQRRIASP